MVSRVLGPDALAHDSEGDKEVMCQALAQFRIGAEDFN